MTCSLWPPLVRDPCRGQPAAAPRRLQNKDASKKTKRLPTGQVARARGSIVCPTSWHGPQMRGVRHGSPRLAIRAQTGPHRDFALSEHQELAPAAHDELLHVHGLCQHDLRCLGLAELLPLPDLSHKGLGVSLVLEADQSPAPGIPAGRIGAH